LGFIRCVAVDYDGTLTLGGPIDRDTAGALVRARRAGIKLVLVTGRMLAELFVDDPEIGGLVDAIVAENGAVVHLGGVARHLASPIDRCLVDELAAHDVHMRRGEVILAGSAQDRGAVDDLIAELGLDVQLVGNRSELMAVPAGVTKATGLRVALRTLGSSPHNTLAIGDAENDLAMLADCEVSVAVANAVDSVRAAADVTTTEPGGRGVAEILDGPIVRAGTRPHRSRWRVTLGTDVDTGEPVTLPAAGINLLISGPSGSGKSFAAGLLIEQLAALEYSVLVIDPEGDHALLGRLAGVTTIGGSGGFPTTSQAIELMLSGPSALVLDLSQRSASDRAYALHHLPDLAEACRAAAGRPHWIVIDEAHGALEASASASLVSSPQFGHLVVTYRPEHLPSDIYSRMDGEIRGLADHREADVELRYPVNAPPRRLRLEPRATGHVRHWHKYSTATLPSAKGFYFRNGANQPTNAVALNLAEFIGEIAHCTPDVILHHAIGAEFSRWLRHVLHNDDLAAEVAEVEELCRRTGAHGVERAREDLIRVLTDSGLDGRARRSSVADTASSR
jgi:hydroxymethylpyrimidine pyrophosphatase-like HAD family hydrolase